MVKVHSCKEIIADNFNRIGGNESNNVQRMTQANISNDESTDQTVDSVVSYLVHCSVDHAASGPRFHLLTAADSATIMNTDS